MLYGKCFSPCFFFFFSLLHRVFAAACRLSLIVVGLLFLEMYRLLIVVVSLVKHRLQGTCPAVVTHGLNCSAACGIFPDQGLNPCPLHWQEDLQPLDDQESYSVFMHAQSFSHVQFFATPWTVVCQAPQSMGYSRQDDRSRVNDAIQPSHPLSSPSPPALNLSQHQGLFK